MSVKSLLEASYSKQRHHRSLYDAKVLSRQTVRAHTRRECRKAQRDPDGDWFQHLPCVQGMRSDTSFNHYRSARRNDLVTRFFISRVGKHVDDVMKELHVKLGRSRLAHAFWQEQRSMFDDDEDGNKGCVKYHNVRIELDDSGILTRIDLPEPSHQPQYDGPMRGEIEGWVGGRRIKKEGETFFFILYRCINEEEDLVRKMVPFSREDRDFMDRIDEARRRNLLELGHVLNDYQYS